MRKLLTAFQSGIREIRFHPMRSILSLTGIILGVVNLSVLFSVLNGVQNAYEELIDSIGTQDLITVSIDWDKMRFATDFSAFDIGWEDVETLRNNTSTVKSVGAELWSWETVQNGEISGDYEIAATSQYDFEMNSLSVESGRLFGEFDLQSSSRVCVIGSSIAEEFFGDEDPLAQTLKIGDQLFTVIGVMPVYGTVSASGENSMDWKNEYIVIPITTYMNRFDDSGWFTINVQSQSVEMVSATMKEVSDILRQTHNNEDVFSISSLQTTSQEANDLVGIWSTVMGIVAAISLLVGGVGIMNVLLAALRERLREIGIRKAVGASNHDIFILFVLESMMICIIGGILGLAAGYYVSMVLLNDFLAEWIGNAPKFNWSAGVGAMLFSVFVGMLAGIFPAMKASKLSPVEALGYD